MTRDDDDKAPAAQGTRPAPPAPSRWRDAYACALHPEGLLHASWIESLQTGTGVLAGDAPPAAETARAAATWSREARADFHALLAGGSGCSASDAAARLTRELLAQSAPMASVLGAWIQDMSAPGVFEDHVQLRVMALLADDAGVGRPSSSRWSAFGLLAHRHGLPELAVEPGQLASAQVVDDTAFAFPAALLAISRRADLLAAQIAGIDLVLRRAGLMPAWAYQRDRDPDAIDWDRLDLGTAAWLRELGDPAELAALTAAEYEVLDPARRREVADGAAWALSALQRWHGQLLEQCRAALDPELAMAALLRKRAREGSIYHQSYELAGRTLSSWLAQAVEDPQPLLDVLRASRLVRPGDAARSTLTTGLVSSRGPMFRIFSPEDLATISRWIDSLASREPAAVTTTAPAAAYAPLAPSRPPAQERDGVAPHDLREAYYLLQGRSIPATTRAFALRYARSWLAHAAHSVDQTDRSLPKQWTEAGLRAWLLDQHDRHGAEFEAGSDRPLPTREAVIDSTLQLAPLTLIDGAWLQGYTDLHLASSLVGFPLFHTYWDELGNGDPELNHPRIYREVLRQMGVTLAPTGSLQFARDTRLRDASFKLPVYWLCLGKLPRTLAPEILGMNLAMELSGVGGSYRQARAMLTHYGFDTRFVDIHNTIDNVSTGHSAWAADSIDAYMRPFAAAGDSERCAAEWQRVRTGYESLEPLPRRGVRRATFRFRSAGRGRARSLDERGVRHHIAVGAPS